MHCWRTEWRRVKPFGLRSPRRRNGRAATMASTGQLSEGGKMYQHLLVATDGSKLSAKAVAHAIVLAKALGARLTAFYASPGYPMPVFAEGYPYVPMSRKEYSAICEKEADEI